jgi:hypothetical protein
MLPLELAHSRPRMIIQGQSGKAQTERPAKSWLGRLFGR